MQLKNFLNISKQMIIFNSKYGGYNYGKIRENYHD